MNGFAQLRSKAGLSLGDVLDLLGISEETLAAYENGTLQPSPRSIQALKGLALAASLPAYSRIKQDAPRDLFAEVGGLPRRSKNSFSGRSCIIPLPSGTRAIECDEFPFEALSDIAEAESWRKEINRPLSHIHKWWAQRLGTVFRAIILGALVPKESAVLDLFYCAVRIPDAVVFDPFMGSGTTVTEAMKLGARAIGRDINPVAAFLVRNALAAHDRAAVLETFRAIERDVAGPLRTLYEAELTDGQRVPVLYYFWVKTVSCPSCDTTVVSHLTCSRNTPIRSDSLKPGPCARIAEKSTLSILNRRQRSALPANRTSILRAGQRADRRHTARAVAMNLGLRRQCVSATPLPIIACMQSLCSCRTGAKLICRQISSTARSMPRRRQG